MENNIFTLVNVRMEGQLKILEVLGRTGIGCISLKVEGDLTNYNIGDTILGMSPDLYEYILDFKDEKINIIHLYPIYEGWEEDIIKDNILSN